MASASACAAGPGGPSSAADAPRGGSDSPRRGRPFRSLRGAKQIRQVQRTGRRKRMGGITVVVADGSPGSPRVGIVAGRSVGRAVDRNRAKRRLREAMARAALADHRDYLVVASRAVVEAPFPEVLGWVRRGVEEQGE